MQDVDYADVAVSRLPLFVANLPAQTVTEIC